MTALRNLLGAGVLFAALIDFTGTSVYAIRDCLHASEECSYYFGCTLELINPPGCMIGTDGEAYCYVECPCGPNGPELCHYTGAV